MRPKRTILMVLITATVVLASLACNISSATPTPVQGQPLTDTVPAAPEGPTPTFTIGPTVTVPCSLNAILLADVTVPDGTEFQPNTTFTKTWRVQNTGDCDWKGGSQLVYVSGAVMTGAGAVDVTPVPAGASAEISVTFVSPAAAGTYKSYWQMRSPEGNLYGALLFVQIVVPGPAVSEAGWHLYRIGDSGPVVYAIQYLLRAAGYSLTADGIFGPATLADVKDFQTLKGLTSDGIVGPATWQALINGRLLTVGSQGEDVKAVQYLLVNSYGYSLTIDGKFGPATRTAVMGFQKTHSLTADGIVGPNTWKTLVTP